MSCKGSLLWRAGGRLSFDRYWQSTAVARKRSPAGLWYGPLIELDRKWLAEWQTGAFDPKQTCERSA